MQKEELSSVIEVLGVLEDLKISAKAMEEISALVDQGVRVLIKHKENLSISSLTRSLLKLHDFSPDLIKAILTDLGKSCSQDEIFNSLKWREGYSLSTIKVLFDIFEPHISPENLVTVFTHIGENSSIYDICSLSTHINSLPGTTYHSDIFFYSCEKFFKALKQLKISKNFKEFCRKICEEIETLDDHTLSEARALKVCTYLAICGMIPRSLATRVLDLHMKIRDKDFVGILHLCALHENPDFLEEVREKVLPEV